MIAIDLRYNMVALLKLKRNYFYISFVWVFKWYMLSPLTYFNTHTVKIKAISHKQQQEKTLNTKAMFYIILMFCFLFDLWRLQHKSPKAKNTNNSKRKH